MARLTLQVADALAYAHAQRVTHRDIKPANLLLDALGTVWVTDFGLAKEEGIDLTQTGDIVGTLRTWRRSDSVAFRMAGSDVYSLGLTLYELITLRPAFDESDRVRLIRQITHDEPRSPRRHDPRVPRDLETIVLKASAKSRAPVTRRLRRWPRTFGDFSPTDQSRRGERRSRNSYGDGGGGTRSWPG